MNKVIRTFQLPKSQDDALKRLAKMRQKSVSALLREIVKVITR